MAVKIKGAVGYWGVINLSESLKGHSDLKNLCFGGTYEPRYQDRLATIWALVATHNQSLFKALMARSRAVL